MEETDSESNKRPPFAEIQALAALAEHGTIDKAAKALGISTVTLKARLNALEEYFPYLKLTATGPNKREVLPDGYILISHWDEIKEFGDSASHRGEVVQVLASSTYIEFVWNPNFHFLHEEFPDVIFDVRELPSWNIRSNLSKQPSNQIALISEDVTLSGDFEKRELGKFEMGLFVPSLEEIPGEPTWQNACNHFKMAMIRTGELYNIIDRSLAGRVSIRPRLRSDSYRIIARSIANTNLAAFLPVKLRTEVPNHSMIDLTKDLPGSTRSCWAVFRKHRETVTAVVNRLQKIWNDTKDLKIATQ